MYLFDARIVAANGAALADGRFSFLPDADNQVELVVPDGDQVAVEIDERVVCIRLVQRAERKADGFFAVEYADVMLTTELVTSRILGDQSFARSLEAKWVGPSGHARVLRRLESVQAADPTTLANTTLALHSMTLRSKLCPSGLQVAMTADAGGVVTVGRGGSEMMPRGKIEVAFILSWSWIAIRGWLLARLRPFENPLSAIASTRRSIDPRYLGYDGLMWRLI